MKFRKVKQSFQNYHQVLCIHSAEKGENSPFQRCCSQEKVSCGGLFVCLAGDKEKKVVWFLLLETEPDFIYSQLLFFPYCLSKMLVDPILDKDITVETKHDTH